MHVYAKPWVTPWVCLLVVIEELFRYLVDTSCDDKDMFVLSRKYYISEVWPKYANFSKVWHRALYTLFHRKNRWEILCAKPLPHCFPSLLSPNFSFCMETPFWRLMPKGERFWDNSLKRESFCQIRFLICMVCARIDFNSVSLLRTTHDSMWYSCLEWCNGNIKIFGWNHISWASRLSCWTPCTPRMLRYRRNSKTLP